MIITKQGFINNNPLSNFVIAGKINIIINGQFGSTGKGLTVHRVILNNYIDVVVSNLSPNARYTIIVVNEKYVVKKIPVGGALDGKCQIF